MDKVLIGDFEGPLDLLLHLIKKSKMEIFDIEISIITNQYINYIEEMKDLNLDIASEYLVMAAELIEMKSRKLLPKMYEDEEEIEEENPEEVLKKRWLNKNNAITTAIQEKYFDTLWYKPIVVLSNSKSLLNINFAPHEIKKNTIRVDHLISYIKKDIDTYDKDLLKNQKEMLKIANSFLKININEYTSIKNKYKVRTNIEEELKSVQAQLDQYLRELGL